MTENLLLQIALIALAIEAVMCFFLSRLIWGINSRDERLWLLILYSNTIHRVQHSKIQFQLHGREGQLKLKAQIALNNLGLISRHDYYEQKVDGEFRIIVLGGEQTASTVADISWPDVLQSELSAMCPGQNITVLNFGWPDAGPEHYIETWVNEASKFNPDLVLVNYVESDFYRKLAGALPTHHKRAMSYGNELRFGFHDEKASLYAARAKDSGGPLSLANPDVIASRPYFVIPDQLFLTNSKLVKELQAEIVRQQIEPYIPPFGLGIISLIRNLHTYLSVRVSDIRGFDPPASSALDISGLAQYGADKFGWIAKNIPNVLLIHNFHGGELTADYVLTERMKSIDPRMPVVDMRQYIPEGASHETIESWYLHPYMGEKWSNEGHKAYAKMVAVMLKKEGKLAVQLLFCKSSQAIPLGW